MVHVSEAPLSAMGGDLIYLGDINGVLQALLSIFLPNVEGLVRADSILRFYSLEKVGLPWEIVFKACRG